jgi:2-C-methyl-D-erythritol 4-phosphate cytidylyltransferase/2-C-methyl-D-erythritol 2,4-cyclodiphosphate synthase
VAAGLAVLAADTQAVAVHDAARPLVSPELFHATLQHAVTFGSGVASLPVVDTLKRAIGGVVTGAVDRSELVAMQTPQAFSVALLRRAAQAAWETGLVATDEASLVEALGEPVRLVPGSPQNLKVTQPEDFALAAALLAAGQKRTDAMDLRMGYGYDVHRLEPGRELWLGGVQIDSPVGLLGHSDADALLHAITDALLGAAAMGDIGRHFPDTDPAFRGIRSMLLLERAYALVLAQGFAVQNVDATVVAQQPRLAPHIPAMVERIAVGLAVSPTRVNVKATTHEGLDDLGAGLGIAAHAVVLLARVAGESRETC